jgi:hypothetical protein
MHFIFMNKSTLCLWAFLLSACEASEAPGPEVMPDAMPPPEQAPHLVVDGWPDRQVRTGAGEVTLRAAGGPFATTVLTVGTVTVVATREGEDLVARWNVPAGAAPSSIPVRATTSTGEQIIGDLVITPITIWPLRTTPGEAALGTEARPYGTLAGGLAVARPGDLVRIWGRFELTETLELPDRVSLSGSPDGTTVVSPAPGSSANVGIRVGTDAHLSRLVVEGFPGSCVAVAPPIAGPVSATNGSLSDVVLKKCGIGLFLNRPGIHTVTRVSIEETATFGLAAELGQVVVDDLRVLSSQGTAIDVEAQASIEGDLLVREASVGIELYGGDAPALRGPVEDCKTGLKIASHPTELKLEIAFQDNQLAVLDDRPGAPAANEPVLDLRGSTMDGVPPAEGMVVGPIELPPQLRITGPNQRVRF